MQKYVTTGVVWGFLRFLCGDHRKAVSEKTKCQQFTTYFPAMKPWNLSPRQGDFGKTGHYVLLWSN